jgi:hypothetical protein
MNTEFMITTGILLGFSIVVMVGIDWYRSRHS